jgi:hypothetical protein
MKPIMGFCKNLWMYFRHRAPRLPSKLTVFVDVALSVNLILVVWLMQQIIPYLRMAPRSKFSHAGPVNVCREAELLALLGVRCKD